jgi:hypothetical protein
MSKTHPYPTGLFTWLFSLLCLIWTGCGDASDVAEHDHDHGEEANHAHAGHHHDPPHGGTVIRLGDELYHLEWVRDEEAGLMRCYVLDGHMEQFIRIDQTEIIVLVNGPDGTMLPWSFVAAENRATGETIGNTSEFQARLPELPNQNKFEGTIPEVHIQGNRFENIAFQFPEGNEG